MPGLKNDGGSFSIQPRTAGSSGLDLQPEPWRVQPREGTLFRGDEEGRLRYRAMEVLTFLASRPGVVISKEEVFREVWNGAAVEDGALAHCISEIRSALGDSPRNPCFIETIPKRGYRLVAKLELETSGDAADDPAPAESELAMEHPSDPPPPTFVGLSSTRGVSGASINPFRQSLAVVSLVLAVLIAVVFGLRFISSAETVGNGGREAAAAKGARVLVLEIENLAREPGAAWISTAVTELLIRELATGGTLRAVPGDTAARVQRELSLASPSALLGGPGAAKLPAAGREADAGVSKADPGSEAGAVVGLDMAVLRYLRSSLGVDWVVLGTLSSGSPTTPSLLQLSLRAQNSRTGEMLATVVETGSEDELSDLAVYSSLGLRRLLGDDAIVLQGPLDETLELMNPEAERLYYQGLLRLRRLDAVGAVDYLEKSVAFDDQAPSTHFALAEALALLGHDRRAAGAADRALALAREFPGESRLWMEARCHALEGEWREAIDDLQTLISLDGGNPQYGRELALAQLRSGKPKDALETVSRLRRRLRHEERDLRLDLVAAEATGVLGDYERSLIEARTARREALRLGAGLVEGKALLGEAKALYFLGRTVEAEDALEAGRARFSEVGDRSSAATAAVTLAGWLGRRGDAEAAEATAQKALSLFREIGNRRGEAEALRQLGVLVARREATVDDSRRFFHQALGLFRAEGDRAGEAATLSTMAIASFDAGRPRNVAEFGRFCSLFEEALELHRRMDQGSGLQATLINLGRCNLELGRIPAAVAYLEEAVSLDDRTGTPEERAGALFDLGFARGHHCDFSGAIRAFEASVELHRKLGGGEGLAAALEGLGRTQLMIGRLEDSESALGESLRVRRMAGDPLRILVTLRALARLRAAQGETEASLQLGRESIKLAEEAGNRPHLLGSRAEYAFLLHEAGRIEEAQTLAEELKLVFDPQRPQRTGIVGFRIDLARILAPTGDITARQRLAEDLAFAKANGLEALRLEAELATLEIEEVEGLSRSELERLRSYEEDYRRRDFQYLAQRARRLLERAGEPLQETPAGTLASFQAGRL